MFQSADSAVPGATDGMAERLRAAGLRPTRQRVALGRILFARGHRHISAEELHDEAGGRGVRVSLATIYNTLHQFTEAGLLRQVTIDATRTYFDTNVGDHHHFFVEGENRLIDFEGEVDVARLPEPPEGMEITSVEVVVRVRHDRGRLR
ncbi:iron response transcriptional regulator IrrA [Faunimonas sp. B44]